MHSTDTRHEFLRLRLSGLSLARIARQLGVSKPTLIAWNRQFRPALQAAAADNHRDFMHQLASGAGDELATLQRRLTAIQQELLSRGLREVPTPTLEHILGDLRQRIRQLQPASPQLLPSSNPTPNPGQEPALSEPIRT